MTNEGTWAARKLGAEGSATRAALINAAQRLLLEEGYAAVTSRRVANAANLKPQLVHYYFRSMEDLLLEVFRRGAAESRERLVRLMETGVPQRAFWHFVGASREVAFITEFTALASRSEAIRAELVRFAEDIRQLQTDALKRHLTALGVEITIPPVLAIVLMASIATMLAREAALGVTLGHAEANAFVEAGLREFEETGGVTAVTFAKWPDETLG
jgi:TetR/AcrR family transcriptional regulator